MPCGDGLHPAKGWNFDVVFMVGVENGLLPHRKALLERPDAGLAEERRSATSASPAPANNSSSATATAPGRLHRGKGVKFDQVRPSQFLLESGLMTEYDYLRKAPKAMVS